MANTYEETITALGPRRGFNDSGVFRWPHHQFSFRYPDFSLLLESERPTIPVPTHHEVRSKPVRMPYSHIGALSCLTLVPDAGREKPRTQKRKHTVRFADDVTAVTPKQKRIRLANDMDRLAQKVGDTHLTLVTFVGEQGPDLPTFRIQRVTRPSDRDEEERTTYLYTTQEFYTLHQEADCAGGACRHWWHYIEALVTRCSDLTYLKVQEEARLQEVPLPDISWQEKLDDFGMNIAGSSTIQIWREIAKKLQKYDRPLVERSRRSSILRLEVLVDKSMIEGVEYLLRFARNKSFAPRHLNPARSNEAGVMAAAMGFVIENRHGWSLDPHELYDMLVMATYRALAPSAVPAIAYDVGHIRQIPVAPGFHEFLTSFITQFVHWCLDEDREYQHVYYCALRETANKPLKTVDLTTSTGEVKKVSDEGGQEHTPARRPRREKMVKRNYRE